MNNLTHYSRTMETRTFLPTSDGYQIEVKMNTGGNERVVIFAHGLTGSMHEHHYCNAVPCFLSQGYDVCRCNFYSHEKTGRRLSECSISTHAEDLAEVIAHCSAQYKEISLVGHSLAGPVILRTGLEKVKKVVLWDPTAGLSPERKTELRYCEEVKKYIKGGRTEVLLSEEMVREWEEASNLTDEVKRITKPTKFIFAGMHYSAPLWMEALKNQEQVETVTIPKATHTFMEEGVEETLFSETLGFFIP